ncbi:recombinase family protein [Liquorilactobacillus hordei]|uniref:recombinase family protein n=1 Tax=Liquorilactobacillus hordei TaxID=468911 RepID=UPI001CC12F11|nr:recombinase family protein [Liquorilactobacillus hordei]MBZ2406619.1 resolvase [Liquorilactobacillus hordei]
MTKIGYARVSSREQNLARQIEQLKAAGVKKLFKEKVSGKNTERPQLKKMMDYIRDDDEVVVLSLDRLGRNSKDLTDIIEEIRKKGATLNVLNLPSFASVEDPNLRNLITNIIVELYKYIAQEERETIKERQRQGIEIAKKQGKYKGKVREYSSKSPNRQKRYIYNEAVKLLEQKERGEVSLTKRQIARMLGIAPVTLYRIEKYNNEEKI